MRNGVDHLHNDSGTFYRYEWNGTSYNAPVADEFDDADTDYSGASAWYYDSGSGWFRPCTGDHQ